MVPMLTCGLVRSNFAFATGVLLVDCSLLLTSCAPARRVAILGLSGRTAAAAPRSEPQDGSSCMSCRRPAGSVPAGRLVHSPVALAMISLATLEGTSAYESNCIE